MMLRKLAQEFYISLWHCDMNRCKMKVKQSKICVTSSIDGTKSGPNLIKHLGAYLGA